MTWLADPQTWVALVTLTVLEIVLGIDNIIFISILAGKLPDATRERARRIGLLLAMVTRILLLLSLAWIIRLTRPLVTVLGNEISGRDLILIAGGLFLIAKSTSEIHGKLEGDEGEAGGRVAATFKGVVIQIMLLDIVFSLDSVITAVGMAQHVEVMVAAIMISVALMMWWSKPIGDFVERHPTIKILALSFLLLIGVTLIADGLGQHISKGYVYFAMGFSVFVEMMNLRMKARAKAKPIHLRTPYAAENGTA